MATKEEIRESLYKTISSYILTANPVANEAAQQSIKDYALMMSSVIADSIDTGTGGSGGVVLTDYIKKEGGVDGIMSGVLTADHGLLAGIEGVNILSFENNVGLKRKLANFSSSINLQTDILYNYNHFLGSADSRTIEFNKDNVFDYGVNFYASPIKTTGSLQIGATDIDGFFTDDTVIKYKNNDLFHTGNANKDTVNWSMLNGTVAGTLSVAGVVTLKSSLDALYGLNAGTKGNIKLATRDEGIEVVGDIYIGSNFGLVSKYNSKHILKDTGTGLTELNASGKDLLLGKDNTLLIRLMSKLTDESGTRDLIDKFGYAKFNWGLVGGIDGVITHQAVSRGTATSEKGTILYNFLDINTTNTKIKSNANFDFEIFTNGITTTIGRNGSHLNFNTNAIKTLFNKPIYAIDAVGVVNSNTRLEKDKVVVGSNNDVQHYLQNMPDGSKLFGKLYITDDLTTETFSTGFSGSGMRLKFSDSSITADEITVRKKIRSYENEVQKITSVNGSFWISSSCSGDSVEEIV